MDNLNRKFEETYGEIISESFGKAITNFAKLKWTDKAKNKELKKTLDKVLTSYGFSNLDGDDDEEENLSDWSKVEIWNKKDGTKKYIKIIISNAIFKESGDVQYSIRAINAISGKKIGVPGHNFILKPRYTENDMVKVINGPFANMYGKVKAINMEEQKLEVALDLFGQETIVELGLTEIEQA